ncbi:MAG: hypothetical protein C4558_03575 [Dehalococcoidia bacterium]|nr:MAG: hypothetical protein C4558_03575 [Dehalococcoidia bacterium]
MINKTKWLSGLAVVAVLGSAATPMIASAHSSEGGERTSQSVKAPTKIGASGALATALGVEPAVLEAAVKAALEATPKPTGEEKKDPTARETYRTAFEASLAAELGVTIEQLSAAIDSLKGEHRDRDKHEKILGRKLADALGVTPDALAEAVKAARGAVPRLTGEEKKDPAAREAYIAALEAAIAEHLGITVEAFNAAQETVKAELQTKKSERREAAAEKAKEHFLQVLNRLVEANVITQSQADEILAQYNLGGEERAQIVKRLRSLLHEQKRQNRDERRDGRREEKRERRDEKRGQNKPALERLQKQDRGDD